MKYTESFHGGANTKMDSWEELQLLILFEASRHFLAHNLFQVLICSIGEELVFSELGELLGIHCPLVGLQI